MNAASTLSDQFWEPSRTLTLAAARRHTRFIKGLRLFFVLGAGVMLALLAYFIIDGPDAPAVSTDPASESVRMTNPRYTGLDGDGVPYNLTAEYALRALDNPDAVRLVNPVLTFSRIEGAQSSNIVAKEGLYDSKAQIMELRTDVVVNTDDGYVCETTHARIYAAKKTVEGDEKVYCEGNFGTVRGDRYEILDNYSRFIFMDNVKAMLLPEPENALETENTPKEDQP